MIYLAFSSQTEIAVSLSKQNITTSQLDHDFYSDTHKTVTPSPNEQLISSYSLNDSYNSSILESTSKNCIDFLFF